jgi:glycosyltransferase involved in cell wall biosynthesis
MLRALGSATRSVEFIDAVPLEEVPRMLERASVAVFPSLWENFPNVCLEAMASGRAIVASKEGGMVDMLSPSQGGVFIDPNDPQEIANALIELFNHPDRIRQMGERNRHWATQYYGKELVRELFDTYRKLCFH